MTTTSPTVPLAPPASRTAPAPALLVPGALAGVAGGVAATAVALAGLAAGVPMEVAAAEGEPVRAIPVAAFLLVTAGWAAVGLVGALAARRWAPRPAATWTVLAVVVTVASLVPPATVAGATTATRVVLDLTHVAAAAVVVPVVARRLPRARGRAA